jgi:glycosyltransferase involved in cell wall biosynthesis
MRVLSFTGGAGAMYCGSCLRDNALAAELLRRGHDVVLSPVYTPTKTDEKNVSADQVFFGGISVYLEQHSAFFRRTPRVLDRLWDSQWALRLATKRQIKVDAKSLGEMTVSMLRGERGFQAKEIDKLLDWLRTEPRFDVINLPYSLLLGLVAPLKRALGTPIAVTLQGDDLFLDGLGEPYRAQSMALIKEASAQVDAFLPVSQYYMNYMPAYLDVPRSKMRLATLGINVEDFTPRPAHRSGPFTIGYLARVAPEKGLDVLADAYIRLRTRPRTEGTRLIAAGYMAAEHEPYLDAVRRKLRGAGLEQEFEYRGELDRAHKVSFLHEMDVLSVPTTYREPKGMFVFEAMACGVPVVQPAHGAFPEIVERTGGGLVVEPGNPEALADGIMTVRTDTALAESMSKAGAAGVRHHYTVSRMAEHVEATYSELVERRDPGTKAQHSTSDTRFEPTAHS